MIHDTIIYLKLRDEFTAARTIVIPRKLKEFLYRAFNYLCHLLG